MRIVTTNEPLNRRFSIEKSIELIAEAGFDGIDFSDIIVMTKVWEDSYKDYAKYLCNLAQNHGVVFTQTHAPIVNGMLKTYEGDMQFIVDRLCRSIEFSALLGAEYVIMHPIQNPKFATEKNKVFEENMKLFSKLVSCAKNNGIKIAIENMVMASLDNRYKRDGVCADPDEFKKYIDSLNSEYVTGCLDFGHSSIAGREPQDMLRCMGSEYIKSMHIHDNDFVNDSHQLPCTMKMNWDEICKAMAQTGYKGDFTLEAVCYFNNFDDDFIPEALSFMYKTAKHLVDKINKYKLD